jgi:hypothetical protein
VRFVCVRFVCALFVWAALAGRLAAEPLDEPPLTAADREHWAFQPLASPPLPEVRDAAWCRGALDRFILARLEQQGLAPMPPADRLTLLRRLSFDLTGLPPSPGEIQAFLADSSPEACERLVDRLLASPAYGERWAQHWLDLARFAETDGFEHDHLRPDAWRYRDWVISALNADLPYDGCSLPPTSWRRATSRRSRPPASCCAAPTCPT